MNDTFNKLIKEFGSELAEEMIVRIICGESVDSAIQSAIMEQ